MEEKIKIPSKKNIIKLCLSLFIVICIVILLASYLINDGFRSWIDTQILRKEVAENTANTIEINTDDNPYIMAYDKYVAVLSKKALILYNQDTSNREKIEVDITNPLGVANDKYFVLAEKDGKKLYGISNLLIQWEKEVDGQIYRISVNKNGYVSVLLKDALHKSVIVIYDQTGKELFKSYLSKSYAICAEVSDNHKYLATGQIDYSGTVLKSIVRIISIDSAINNSEDAVLYKYESESSKLLNNIKFNSKNEAICMFDSYIQKVTTNSDERLYDITSTNLFVDINLKDHFVVVNKEKAGLFSYQYQVNIKSTTGKGEKLYILESNIPKEMKLSKNLIGMKLVNEVRLINDSGWLVKRYTTKSEIQDMVLNDHILGIVYHNKIEVIGL